MQEMTATVLLFSLTEEEKELHFNGLQAEQVDDPISP